MDTEEFEIGDTVTVDDFFGNTHFLVIAVLNRGHEGRIVQYKIYSAILGRTMLALGKHLRRLSNGVMCECGASMANQPNHSRWCPKFNGEELV